VSSADANYRLTDNPPVPYQCISNSKQSTAQVLTIKLKTIENKQFMACDAQWTGQLYKPRQHTEPVN